MTTHWNAKRDLELLGSILARELEERDVAVGKNLPRALSLSVRDGNALNVDIALPVRLSRADEILLTAAASTIQFAIEDIVELSGDFADAIEEVEKRRSDLVDALSHFRRHLRKRLTALRRKGLRITGEAGMGRTNLGGVSDAWPVITLRFPGADLRPCSHSFGAEDVADIDLELAVVRDAITARSQWLDELNAVGGAGLIHPLLHAALARCGGGAAATIDRIMADPLTHQDLVDADGEHLVVYWKKGILTGTFGMAPGLRLVGDKVEFDAFPHEVSEVRSGAPLSTVIDLPALADTETEIRAASGRRGARAAITFSAAPRIFRDDGTLV